MFLQKAAACFAALAAVSATSEVRADVTLGATPFVTPYLVGTGTFGVFPFEVDGDGSRSLIAVGSTLLANSDGQTSLVFLGPAGAGTIGNSTPVLSAYVPGGVATSALPEPMLVLVGARVENSFQYSGLQVFAGSPLRAVYTHEFPFYSFNTPLAVTLTRIASLADFDVAIGNEYGIDLFASAGSASTWHVATGGRALATLPAAGTQPAELIAVGNDEVDLLSIDDGHTLWTSTATGGTKVLIGNITGGADPEFVVRDANGRMTAFGSNPPALLWQKTDANAADFSLGDRNGDGTQDIAVATADGKVLWLNGNGVAVVGSVTLSYPAARIAVAKLDSAPARVVTIADAYTGAELQARSLDLGVQVADVDAFAGPFDRIAIGDLDGDGDEEIVSLSAIPWGFTPMQSASSGLLSIRDLASHAMVWQSAIPSGLGPTSSDVMTDVAIGRLQPGAGQQIVALGTDIGDTFQPVLDIVDGTTHTLLRRALVSAGDSRVPTHVRLVDVDGDGLAEIVLVSEPADSVTAGVRVHVLNRDTLAIEWTSPVLTPAFPASWVGTRPSGGAGADHLILTVAQAGFWSIDLAAHLVDYSVPADAPSAAYLPDATSTGRITIIDATRPALIITDAASGAEIDRLILPADTYRAVAAMSGDSDRVAIATENHLELWNIASRDQEGSSPLVANRLARSGTLLGRASGDGAVFYAGNADGIWSFPAIEFQQQIFANGFEP